MRRVGVSGGWVGFWVGGGSGSGVWWVGVGWGWVGWVCARRVLDVRRVGVWGLQGVPAIVRARSAGRNLSPVAALSALSGRERWVARHPG